MFTELFGVGNQATLMVALVSLMGASFSISFAMAIAIHYLEEPIATMRQIFLTTLVVLIGFSLVIYWPGSNDATSIEATQQLYRDSASTVPSVLTTRTPDKPAASI